MVKSFQFPNHVLLQTMFFNLESALKKDESYYPQVFLKECKYIEKKLVRRINDSLIDFSSSDEPDGEQIRAIWLIFHGIAIFKVYFLKE